MISPLLGISKKIWECGVFVHQFILGGGERGGEGTRQVGVGGGGGEMGVLSGYLGRGHGGEVTKGFKGKMSLEES